MNLKLVKSRKLRPWLWSAVLSMLLACGACDSGSADPQPVAPVQRPASEAQADADADIDCSIVVLATVPVDAWGGQHHVQGRLILEGCGEDSGAYSAAAGEAAKRYFEELVKTRGFLPAGICLDPTGTTTTAAEFHSELRAEIAGAANRVAGQEVVRRVGCSGMTSAEYM